MRKETNMVISELDDRLKIRLAHYADTAKQVGGGERSFFYYAFKCMVLKYFSIKGRCSRKEYWSFILFLLMIEMALFYYSFVMNDDIEQLMNVLDVWGFATLPPSITALIRRLHDFGKSGWWIFIPSPKVLLFAFIKGDDQENAFGEPE